jgi:hypothetical protein
MLRLKCLAFAYILTLLFFATSLHGQTNALAAQYFPSLPLELQSDVIVLVDWDNPPQPCPSIYTNLFSNTNLPSPAENKLIHEVMLKYKTGSTNSGPIGSTFKQVRIMESSFQTFHSLFPVTFFTYINSNATEEIASPDDKKIIAAKFRTPTGDGYDISAVNGDLILFQGYRNGILNGVMLGINDPNHPDPANNKF